MTLYFDISDDNRIIWKNPEFLPTTYIIKYVKATFTGKVEFVVTKLR